MAGYRGSAVPVTLQTTATLQYQICGGCLRVLSSARTLLTVDRNCLLQVHDSEMEALRQQLADIKAAFVEQAISKELRRQLNETEAAAEAAQSVSARQLKQVREEKEVMEGRLQKV